MNAITKNQAIKLVRRFIEFELSQESWYQDVKEYLSAIIFYGSTAKGTNRPNSDIDLLFILPREIEDKYTAGEYVYPFEEREINIVVRSVEKLRKIAQEKNDLFQKEIFREAKIISDKNGEITRLLNKILSK